MCIKFDGKSVMKTFGTRIHGATICNVGSLTTRGSGEGRVTCAY